jgi:hypothetical protein
MYQVPGEWDGVLVLNSDDEPLVASSPEFLELYRKRDESAEENAIQISRTRNTDGGRDYYMLAPAQSLYSWKVVAFMDASRVAEGKSRRLLWLNALVIGTMAATAAAFLCLLFVRHLVARQQAAVGQSTAILRRSGKSKAPDGEGHVVFEKGGFLADMTAYKVTIDGKPAALAPKLYDLLFFLIRNKNIAVPREKILTEIWGYDYYGDDRTLDTHMKLLRRAMGPYADTIKTLRGLGYRFEG